MGQIGFNDFKGGLKVEIEGQPYIVVSCDFVKPGKGQAFTRVRLKHLTSGRVIERTFKGGDTVQEADVEEHNMRLLYTDPTGGTFMNDENYEQLAIPLEKMGEVKNWLKEDVIYNIIFYKGDVVAVLAPTFMELEITATDPGVRGDTSSGRVMKPAVVSTGVKVQVPIFVEQGEIIKVDTRTGDYVSRVGK